MVVPTTDVEFHRDAVATVGVAAFLSKSSVLSCVIDLEAFNRLIKDSYDSDSAYQSYTLACLKAFWKNIFKSWILMTVKVIENSSKRIVTTPRPPLAYMPLKIWVSLPSSSDWNLSTATALYAVFEISQVISSIMCKSFHTTKIARKALFLFWPTFSIRNFRKTEISFIYYLFDVIYNFYIYFDDSL